MQIRSSLPTTGTRRARFSSPYPKLKPIKSPWFPVALQSLCVHCLCPSTGEEQDVCLEIVAQQQKRWVMLTCHLVLLSNDILPTRQLTSKRTRHPKSQYSWDIIMTEPLYHLVPKNSWIEHQQSRKPYFPPTYDQVRQQQSMLCAFRSQYCSLSKY